MPIWRPRWSVQIVVPNVGTSRERTLQELRDDTTTIDARAYKGRIEYNNHNEADTCEVTCSYDDAGVDPRFMRNCELYVYLANANDYGEWSPSVDNLRFVGIATDVKRSLKNEAKTVTIKAHDYTALFLTHQGYPSTGLPLYSDTLTSAWERICDHTGYYELPSEKFPKGRIVSTVQVLKSRIVFQGVDPATPIGKAVSKRLQNLGALQVAHNADAWGVWQTVVGSLGLLSFIDRDHCVVTTAGDFYTSEDPPRFIYGVNIEEIEENRDQHAIAGKNVALFAYNPLTGQTLEAYYPPTGLVTPKGRGGKHKKLAASALGPGVAIKAEDYETFHYPYPVTDQAMLDFCAKRVWEERARQELKGTLKTVKMSVDTLAHRPFDLLSLRAGARVRVEIDNEALTLIQAIPTIGGRIAALQDRGYSAQMATYMAKNLSAISSVTPEFQVHSNVIDFDASTEGTGHFSVDVSFLNRILPSGSAEPNSDGSGD